MQLTKEIVAGFVGSVLSGSFDEATQSPECHLEWWDLCCSSNRYVAIAAPRGHAKSSAITLGYGLAAVLFRSAQFVVIVSDTEAQAINFLGLWKQQLQDNQDLIELFGLKKNEKGQVQFIKEAETDIIVEFNDGHRFRVLTKGSEQKLRGLLWDGQRPDLILCDDIENDELVMNKDRREKFKRWFYGALLPCTSRTGKVRMVGTILHMDSMLENLMPVSSRKDTVKEPLKEYSTIRTVWKSVRYRAHDPDFEHILWETRYDKEFFLQQRQARVEQGIPDVYSQEFLNIPIDESVSYFKKADFLNITEEDKKLKLHYYMAADLAISEKERADYSVFVVGGVDEHRRLHIVNVIRERLDGREIVDTLLALQRAYSFEAVGVEEGQISKAIGPFLKEEMQRTNTYPSLYPMKHMSLDKPTRARSIQARMRARTVKFDKEADWYQRLEDEMCRFPRDKHDDQVDAMAWLGHLIDKMVEAPTPKELKDIAYEEEFNESGLFELGRSVATGY